MREWHEEIKNRVEWIKGILQDAGAKGIVIGMSSGKDSNTVAALSKLATDNVLGVSCPVIVLKRIKRMRFVSLNNSELRQSKSI